MEAEFWHTRWENMQIGFHEGEVNRMLAAHLAVLGLAPRARLFLPLCGKTRDIAWLLAQGYRVVGAELSEIAVRQLFEEMGVTPQVTEAGTLRRYASEGIDILAGDIFDLTADVLGAVDAVYDRAALVALPEAMRGRYATHLAAITAMVPQLLITFEYDPSVMQGPPFSLTDADVRTCHGARFDISVLAEAAVPGGLKGFCPAQERAILLLPKPRAGRETSLNTA